MIKLSKKGLKKIQSKIKSELSQYTYGLQELLNEKNLELNYIESEKTLFINRAHGLNLSAKTGICFELMNYEFVRLQKEYPEFQVLRCDGNGKDIFNHSTSSHSFILLYAGDKIIQTPEDISSTLEKEILVVDPSVQLVKTMKQSQYKFRKIYGPEQTIFYPKSRKLNENEGLPLFKLENNELVYLIINSEFESDLGIVFDKPTKMTTEIIPLFEKINRNESTEDFQAHDLYSASLDNETVYRDSQLKQIIDLFRTNITRIKSFAQNERLEKKVFFYDSITNIARYQTFPSRNSKFYKKWEKFKEQTDLGYNVAIQNKEPFYVVNF